MTEGRPERCLGLLLHRILQKIFSFCITSSRYSINFTLYAVHKGWNPLHTSVVNSGDPSKMALGFLQNDNTLYLNYHLNVIYFHKITSLGGEHW